MEGREEEEEEQRKKWQNKKRSVCSEAKQKLHVKKKKEQGEKMYTEKYDREVQMMCGREK